MSRLRKWYVRQQFDPGALGWAVNPFYHARRSLRAELAVVLPTLKGRVLDVGCGSRPYAELVTQGHYVGMDWESSSVRDGRHADIYYNGTDFPLPDTSVDHVICTQVLEHVFNPTRFLAEIHRVLKPGGRLVMSVPFVWDEHEQPYDFARYSSFGLRAILTGAGMGIEQHRKLGADARVFAQLLNAWLYKVTLSRNHWWNLFVAMLVMGPVNLIGWVAGAVLPRNYDLYLDNFVVATRPTLPETKGP